MLIEGSVVIGVLCNTEYTAFGFAQGACLLVRSRGCPYVMMGRTHVVYIKGRTEDEQPEVPVLRMQRGRRWLVAWTLAILICGHQVIAESSVMPRYLHRRCETTLVLESLEIVGYGVH